MFTLSTDELGEEIKTGEIRKSPRKKARLSTLNLMAKQQSNKRERDAEIVQSCKKNSLEFIIDTNKLIELRKAYLEFLSAQKEAGTGPTSNIRSKQNDRQQKITEIDRLLGILIEAQSFENWTQLLVTLITYHTALYTENWIRKTDSTFGDALRAVHGHILEKLKRIGEVNAIKESLAHRIHDHISGNIEITLDLLNHTDVKIEQTADLLTILKAAFGDYEGLQHYYTRHPGLEARLTTFAADINLRIQEPTIGYASFYTPVGSPAIKGINPYNPSSTK